MPRNSRHVALLRGINVGGKNKLPMRTLVELFEGLGCGAVQTYIQSGNVVFEAPVALARRVPELAAQAIAAETGLDVPVLTRTAAQLKRVLESNPFLDGGLDPAHTSVGFLARRPTAAQVRRLDPERSPGDAFEVRGSEVYFHFPNGIARTKLTSAWFDRELETTLTVRNWKTTRRLGELASA